MAVSATTRPLLHPAFARSSRRTGCTATKVAVVFARPAEPVVPPNDAAGSTRHRDLTNAEAQKREKREKWELANEQIYKALTEQLESGDLAGARALHQQIDQNSVYFARAKEAVETSLQEFLAKTRTRAQEIVAQHKCAELKSLASEAAQVTPEARAAADLPCSTPPESLDPDMVKKGIAKVRPKVLSACNNVSPAKGQVTVSVTFAIARDGHVMGVTVKNAPNATLRKCVADAMQRAMFLETQSGGSGNFIATFKRDATFDLDVSNDPPPSIERFDAGSART